MGFTLQNYTLTQDGRFSAKVLDSVYCYTTRGSQDFEGPLFQTPAPLAATQDVRIYASKQDFLDRLPPLLTDHLYYGTPYDVGGQPWDTTQTDLAICITGNFPPDWAPKLGNGSPVPIASLKAHAMFCLRNHPIYKDGVWD